MSLSVWCVEHPTRTRERRAPRCAFSLFHVGPASRNCFFFPAGSATYIRSSARLNDLRSPPKEHTTLVTRVPLRSHVFPTLNRFTDVQPPLPTPRSHLSTWHGLTHNPLRTTHFCKKSARNLLFGAIFHRMPSSPPLRTSSGTFQAAPRAPQLPKPSPGRAATRVLETKTMQNTTTKGRRVKRALTKSEKLRKRLKRRFRMMMTRVKKLSWGLTGNLNYQDRRASRRAHDATARKPSSATTTTTT